LWQLARAGFVSRLLKVSQMIRIGLVVNCGMTA
jgi:hypothetical protein